MATLTEEEQEFIRNNQELFNSEDLNLLTTETESDSVDPSTGLDPAIQEMFDSGLITLEEAQRENKDRFGQATQEPSYVSESSAQSSAGSETKDYDFFYDPKKDSEGKIIAPTPSGLDKPESPSLATTLKAGISDAADFIFQDDVRPPTASQQEVEQFNQELAAFEAAGREWYQTLPEAPKDPGVKVYFTVSPDGKSSEMVKVPPPNSTAFQRVFDQAGSNIYQQFGALGEGAVVSESQFEKDIPDYDQSGFENVLTQIFTYGAPASVAAKGLTVGGRTLGLLRGAQTPLRTGAAILAGEAISDTIMTTKNEEGLIFDPQDITTTFGLPADSEAGQSVAMFLDALVVNKVFDGVLGVGGAALGFVKRKSEGLKDFTVTKFTGSTAGIDKKSSKNAILSVMKIIDPSLEGASPQNVKRNLYELSKVLNANQEQLLKIGETEGLIELDTINAFMGGAEGYVKATRQSEIKNFASFEEWDQYTKDEATKMVYRMIGVVRSGLTDDQALQAQGKMLNDISAVIQAEGRRLTKDGGTIDVGKGNVEALMEQQKRVLTEAEARLSSAEADVALATERVNQAVANDPTVAKFLEGKNVLDIFSDAPQREAIAQLLGTDLYNIYKRVWDQNKRNYEAIPNDPISPEAKKAFIEQVKLATSDASSLDTSGGATKRILGAIAERLKPKTVNVEMDESMMLDGVPTYSGTQIQTVEQLSREVGDIGFGDLYNLRKELTRLIDGESQPAVKERLIALRNHITDGENGQIAFLKNSENEQVAQLAEAADSFFIEAKNRLESSEPLRQLSEKFQTVRYQGETTAVPENLPFAQRRGEPDLEASIPSVTTAFMEDISGAKLNSLVNAFTGFKDRPEVLQPFIDLYLAQRQEALSKALQSGGSQSVEAIRNAFSANNAMLPEELRRQLNEASQRIERTIGELGNEKLAAEALAKDARERLKIAENNVLSNFFTSVRELGIDAEPVNPRQVIRDVTTSKDAANKTKALFKQIDAIPDELERENVRNAVQGTMLDNLVFDIFGATPTALLSPDSIARTPNIRKLKELNTRPEAASNLLQGLEQAFKDKPEVVQGLRIALDSLEKFEIPSRLKANKAGSDTSANQNVRDSVSTAILMGLGYMNPTAAAARRLTAAEVARIEQRQKTIAQETMSLIMADPKKFSELAKELAKPTPSSDLVGMLVRELKYETAHYLKYETRVGPDSTDNEMGDLMGNIVTGTINQASKLADPVLDFLR